MTTEILEDYLDGALDASGVAGVERAIASDSATAALLGKLRRQRELRAAAYASYMPSASEASDLAARVMAEAHAPVGKIGPSRVRWLSGIAAALVLMAGAFGVGRMTAPETRIPVAMPGETMTKTEYQVVYIDKAGDMQQHTFQTTEDRDAFIAEVETGGNTLVTVAEINPAGHM